ncbi:late secretory pathway protein avl9 [Mortierella hygrophila]|uniref:Late secretory pathway protein avl9 n=1 Tax=Mortierella hygrophila TaxID=979708 RepID=A0A9P6EZD0_9FUNG|nr:late secretory pathway protein avl9 [Mortierella hygrophila]
MGVILHIIVVGFHHAHGPIVEYAYPPFPGQAEQTVLTRLEVPEEWSLLPFLALPDGSHQSDEDFTYFHLPPVKSRKDVASTLFGISCNRQILTKDLVVKTDDVTRSSVQKAIVVLATQPIFGVLRQRLAVVTAAWFGQKDFTQTEILAQFYDSLNATVSESIPDSAFLMGTSLRELVKKFKYKVLVLLKLLLLEKRVIFFGYPVETLCTYQYSLMSLVPGLLKSLQDTGSPLLDSQEDYMRSMSKTPAHSTDKQELFKYLGLPLHIFGEGSFFQPYLPLQQIDILQDPRTRSYIIGTTNAIFLHNRDCGTDVIVNTEPGTIEFLQDSLSGILSLTSADRRWMDEVIQAVNESESTDSQTEYAGSDDYLRAKFEEYILTLLSSVKHAQKVTQTEDSTEGMGNPSDRDMTADYGTYFIRAWQQTPNYQLWNGYVDWELLNEIVAPGHPCQGNFSLAHVQRRLANQLKDMRIDKNLVPLKQSFSRAMTTSRERISNVFDSVWLEFEKLQPEEGPQPASLEPGVYRPRSREPSLVEGKGLVRSTSTNRRREPTARSIPDPDATPDDDSNDAISPPVSYKSSSRRTSMQQQPASRTSSAAASPVPSISSSLGPATAATAALGQKAAGMFSNVSSFFQTKKKELLDAQREAEEQYQQRVHQHERKKKIMQERARATASTFAISPKPVVGAAKANPGSGSGPDLAVSQQQQQGEPGLFSFVTPRSPTRSQASPRSPTSPKGARSPLSFTGMATGSPEQADASTAATTGKSTDVADEPAKSVPIVSPVPVPVPTVVSPRLSRGGEVMSSFGEGGLVKDVDQESQQEIEKELLEALETLDNIVPTSPSASRLSAVAATQPGLTALLTPTPERSVTPGGESYSPFSEVSVPSSPVIGATEASTIVVDDPLGVSSSQEELSSKDVAIVDAGNGETGSSNAAGVNAVALGEALPL